MVSQLERDMTSGVPPTSREALCDRLHAKAQRFQAMLSRQARINSIQGFF